MKHDDLISIVVPFYNVCDSVQYCLDSLRFQTYKNIEILCIDDGSTDNTAKKIERYTQKDRRIKLIRSENKGLSAARNIGVEHAKGKYITFVDGDDTVSPLYIGSLYKPFQNESIDLSLGEFARISIDKARLKTYAWTKKTSYVCVNREQLIEQTLYDRPMISGCAHLAFTEIYRENPFVANRLFEDTLSYDKHIAFAQNAAIIPEPIYGYVSRSGSITDKKKVSADKILQFMSAFECIETFVENNYPSAKKALRYHLALEITRMHGMAVNLNCKELEKLLTTYCKEWMKKNISFLRKDDQVPFSDMVRFSIFNISPLLYPKILTLWKKANRL